VEHDSARENAESPGVLARPTTSMPAGGDERPRDERADARPAGDKRAEPSRPPRATATLEDLLERGPLEPARALSLLSDVADELDAARARCDADPSVEPAGIVVDAARGDRARPGAIAARRGPLSAASLQYRSPEQARGKAAGPRSAVYSLAALLHRSLTGEVPFPHGRDRAVSFWHLHAPRPRPTAVRPALPAAIDAVVERGMAVDPRERHPTARALIDDARRALGIAATPPAPRPAFQQAEARIAAADEAAAEAGSSAVAQPPASTERRPRARRAFGRVILVLLAAVVVGSAFIVAGGLRDAAAPSAVASAGPLQLSMPSGWVRRPATPAPALLGLRDPIVLEQSARPGNRLIAGTSAPSAIVAALARLRATPVHGELVSLGRNRARRYAARLPGVVAPLVLYLTPLDRGIATVACRAADVRAAASFAPRCEAVVRSLRVVGRRFAPMPASDPKAAGVARVFALLNAARARYRSRITRAATAAAQARAARAVARAHATAAGRVRGLRLTGLAQPGGARARHALEGARHAYLALAGAARRGDARRYATARKAALAADLRIRRALRLLRLVGYSG
jgi:hypothetical protein